MTSPLHIYRSLQRGLRFSGMAALLGLVMITATDVLGRVLFNAPLGFAYELIGVLLGFGIYAGLVGMAWQRDHIRIDLLEGAFNRFWHFERWRDRFSWVLEGVFLGILAIFMARQAHTIFVYQETFLFLPVEKWMPLIVFAGLVILALLACLFALKSSLRGKPEDLL